MSNIYKFPDCNCSFPILKEAEQKDVVPFLDIKDDELPLCPKIWKMLSEGKTKGIFQLESDLGRHWCKKLKPQSAEHLSALSSILRPGPLKSLNDKGISMTEMYSRCKNGEEEVKPYHPAVDKCLSKTYNQIIYQEEILALSKILAGFSDRDADMLRKAVGKKDQQALAKVKTMFIDGCAKTQVVSKEQAEEIWGWIEKSGRYCFNHCLFKDTFVLDGNVPHRGMKVQDLVDVKEQRFGLSANFGEYRIQKNKIVKVTYAGRQAGLRILLEDDSHLGNFDKIEVTHTHKFPTPKGEKKANELKVGDSLYVVNWNSLKLKIKTGKIRDIIEIPEEDTYDVEMLHPHHNFVVNDGIITSNSHAMSYGLVGYDTAYLKSHFPVEFFVNWLYYAKEKIKPQDEIRELVEEAKLFDIKVNVPDIRRMNANFDTDRKEIWFGLTDVKDVGKATLAKLSDNIDVEKLKSMSWSEFLLRYSNLLNSRAAKALIMVGAFSWTGKTRMRLLNEFTTFQELTDKERELLIKVYEKESPIGYDFKDLLSIGCKVKKENGICSTKKRVEVIKGLVSVLNNPPVPEVDSPNFIFWAENFYLGVGLTCSKVDSCDISMANATIAEILDGKRGFILIGVEIKKKREIKTKTDKKMCFLEISDGQNQVGDVVVFPNEYKEYGHVIKEGNTLMLECQTDKKTGNLIVQKVFQL